MLRSTLRELPFVVRGLVRRPLVPSVLALVVAVGVAFLATGYTVFDGLLWRKLPYGPPERWMMLGEPEIGEMPRIRMDLLEAYQAAHDRGELPTVEAFIPLEEREANLAIDGVSSREMVTRLLPESFPHLQTPPLLGRFPADPDGARRLAREIAIGEHLWRRRFGGDSAVLGRRVTLNSEAAVIVSVMPEGFQFHRMSQAWAAWSRAEILADPEWTYPLVVRIAEGASASDVIEQTAAIREVVMFARTPRPQWANASRSGMLGRPLVPWQQAALVLATMTLVLLAACLNLATLYLARLRLRAAEHATRLALGAGPRGVLRLLATEVALVVLAGGALAALATVIVTGWIHDSLGAALPFRTDLRVGARGFVAALAALALALVVVAAPALRVARRLDLARLLGHHGVIGGAPRHGRGAGALIAAQVAVVVILAAGSVPVAVSAMRLADVTSGRDDHRVLEVGVALLGARYDSAAVRDTYARRAREALLSDPRVEAVSRVEGFRAWRTTETTWSDTIFTDAEARHLPGRRTRRLETDVVGDDYFRVAGLGIVAGAGFEAGLHEGDEPVALLAAEAARQLFPDVNPVGRRFRRGAAGPWVRVIGIVENDRRIAEDWGGTTLEARHMVYVSERQATGQLPYLHVRTREITPAVVRDVRTIVEAVDPSQAVRRVRPMSDVFAQAAVQRTWMAIVLGTGAAVAVLLALTGTFGLVTYYTAARLREIALRVALGARGASVAWLVAWRTLRSVAIGLAIGSLSLALMQRGIERFAYETSVWDPLVLAIIAAMVGVVAVAALLVPLRRVRRLSPQALLRGE